MKKRNIILGFLMTILLVVLAACGSGSKEIETISYQKNSNGEDWRITYYYEKGTDKVVKQELDSQFSYDFFGMSKDDIKPILDEASSAYQDVKGLSESLDYGETSVKEEVTIDFTKADLKELSKIPGLENYNLEDADYISLKESTKLMKQTGFEEVKDGKFKEFEE